MHEAPLLELVVGGFDLSLVEFGKYLCPGDEQPHDGATFLAYRLEGPFRRHALQDDRLAADDEAAEPVHLGARVIERRDEDEAVILRLFVMGVLGDAGAEHVVVG